MMSKQMPIKFTEKERRKEKKHLNTCIGKNSKSAVQSPNKKLESQKARDKAS